MKKITITLLLFSFTVGFVQAQSDHYFIKNDGTKVELRPSPISPTGMMVDPDYLYYFDKREREIKIAQSDVKEVVNGSEFYTSLPVSKKDNRLLKVIATNDQYILSIYSISKEGSIVLSFALYVHNKQTKEIEGERVIYNNAETDYKAILPTIKKYFNDCIDLFAKMDSNSVKQRNEKKIKRDGPFVGIDNLSCSK